MNLDHAYDEYLKARESEIVSAILEFNAKLDKTHVKFGRFSIPTYFKPHILSPKQEHLLKRVASTLMQVINSAARLYFEESHLTHVFRIPADAAELIKIDPGFSRPVVFSRFDGFLAGEGLKLVEFNCDAPAGMAYSDELEEILLNEKSLSGFFQDYHIGKTSRVGHVLDELLATYEEFGGYENPQIAIVDWRHVKTMPEHEMIKAYFESKGYKTTVADPRELKYKSGKLYHKGFQVDIIYRRVHFDEILQRLDEVQDMIKAYKDRAVCMVNPLRAKLAGTKALLSILTNPEYDHFFTESENKLKQDFIPWTRRLADAEGFYGHKKVYLIDFLKEEKESLVLKPSSGFGGKDVVIGCETPDQDWNSAIDRALKGDWVMQEFTHIPIMTAPVAVNQKLDFVYKKFNYNLFVSGNKYSGGFVRLSDESVINVAKGGGLIPSLSAEHVPDRFEG